MRDKAIIQYNVFRERYVQTVQDLNYMERKQDYKAPFEELNLVNTAMKEYSTLKKNLQLPWQEKPRIK